MLQLLLFLCGIGATYCLSEYQGDLRLRIGNMLALVTSALCLDSELEHGDQWGMALGSVLKILLLAQALRQIKPPPVNHLPPSDDPMIVDALTDDELLEAAMLEAEQRLK